MSPCPNARLLSSCFPHHPIHIPHAITAHSILRSCDGAARRRYYEALRAGNHAYAVTGFRNFVERFPGHDFADNAQYWLGEAFYDQKDYKSALVEFRKVVDNHPQGNKVPDALLKVGYCYSQLAEVDKAKQVWQQVLQVYPKSNPAALAATKLSELEN